MKAKQEKYPPEIRKFLAWFEDHLGYGPEEPEAQTAAMLFYHDALIYVFDLPDGTKRWNFGKSKLR